MDARLACVAQRDPGAGVRCLWGPRQTGRGTFPGGPGESCRLPGPRPRRRCTNTVQCTPQGGHGLGQVRGR